MAPFGASPSRRIASRWISRARFAEKSESASARAASGASGTSAAARRSRFFRTALGCCPNPDFNDSWQLVDAFGTRAELIPPSPTTSTPVTFTCGGGSWTLTLAVTPNGSATSVSSFSALTAAQQAQMNGGQVEVKAVGSVSLLAGLNTGSSLLSLYHISVQGDAIMAVL